VKKLRVFLKGGAEVWRVEGSSDEGF